VPDADAASSLVTTMLELATDSARIEMLSRNVKAMALRDAAERIVDEVEKIIDRNQN
jgi:UDP-N-acetylglucosamine:LPS N-acetylglucosamine transferase